MVRKNKLSDIIRVEETGDNVMVDNGIIDDSDGIDTGCGTYDSRLLDDECGADEKGNGMTHDDGGT